MVFFTFKHIVTPGRRTLPGVVFITITLLASLTGRPIYAQETLTPSVIVSPSPTSEAPSVSPASTPSPTDFPAPSPTLAPITPTVVSSPTPVIQNTAAATTEQIQTGSSSATLNAVTVINTAASGSQPTVLNYTQPTTGTIDLSGSGECTASASAALEAVINNASISNTLTVNAIANPGQAANAAANLFNMANTTVSGSCWNFLVMNFFASHSGNVTLPSYRSFVKPNASNMTVASLPSVVNTVSVNNILNAEAHTGSVTGNTVQTGNAIATINAQNVLNTTITGNNWLFLTIRSYGGWNGTLLNWPGTLLQTPGYLYAYLPLSPGSQTGPSVTNRATVANSVSVNADTAQNPSAGTTGNAAAKINMFNFINTTIAGNNWYFAYITLFDSFTGNFLFPDAATPAIAITAQPSVIPTATAVPAVQAAAAVRPSDIPIPSATIQPTFVLAKESNSPTVLQTAPPIQRKQSPPSPPPDEPLRTVGFFISSSAILSIIIKRYFDLRQTGI